MLYIDTMIRTQIYLEKQHINFINKEAARRKTTMAEIIRLSVQEYANQVQPKSKRVIAGDFLLGLNRVAKKRGYRGGKTLSQDIDKYLYGK